MRFYNGLPALLTGTAIASALIVIQPAIAVALTGEEVNDIAREFTVLIRGNNEHGSGAIIAKDGNTYYVLTANHVVSDQDDYKIVTSDKQAYQIDYSKVKRLPGVDLAIVEFSSDKNYTVGKIANSDKVREGSSIFISGWPKPGNTGQLVRQFPYSRISGVLDTPVDGYKMIYTNVTLPGMSGGPVVDASGRIVGIHGMGDPAINSQELQREGLSSEAATRLAQVVKTGFNYAIPINTFLNLAPQSGIYLSLQVENSPAQELGSNPVVASSSQPNQRDTIDNINDVLNTINRIQDTFQNIPGVRRIPIFGF